MSHVSNPKHIKKLTKQLFGKIYADEGYLSKAVWEMLFADGMQLITKVRKNMKGHIMELKDKLLLRKRTIIEVINDDRSADALKESMPDRTPPAQIR